MTFDYAIHSDFLVHWTGKDLDCSFDPHWSNGDKSETDDALLEKYLERLSNILQYGFWLTAEPEQTLDIDGLAVTIPSTPKTCFTELKLSESRTHARRYGRLGIGVKRPYLFSRCGRPLAYFGFHEHVQFDEFLKACATELTNQELLNFFKPMNSSRTLNYDLYAESEWRIILIQELLKREVLIDPSDLKNTDANNFYRSLTATEQAHLKFLCPLDGWFAMIIYPSLKVKNAAQQRTGFRIKELIHAIKANPFDHGNQVERGSWPIEIDIDACRNF